MSSFRLEVIHDPQALTPYLSFWRDRAPTPLQSPEWMLAWWTAFENPNTQLQVLIVFNGADEVVGLAPFYLRNHWSDGRTVRFLGSGRACGDFQTLLTTPGLEAEVGEQVGQWLLESQLDLGWSLVELEGTPQADGAIDALVDTLRRGRCLQHLTPLENTWRLDLSNGWQGFLDGLSKTQRRQTRNWVNRFEKTDQWNVRVIDDPLTDPQALQQFILLHQKRWIAVGQPGCFADDRFTKFIESACQKLGPKGKISIAFFEDCGRPIACQFYLVDAVGNKYMYQSGRDPERDADGVGRIFNAIAIRQACQEGVGFIDFLRGDEMYKGRLGAMPNGCLRWRLVAPALLPRLRHGLRTLGSGVRNQVKLLRAQWTNAHANEPSPPESKSNAAIMDA